MMLPRLTRVITNMHGVDCAVDHTRALDGTIEIFGVVPSPEESTYDVIDSLPREQITDLADRISEAHDYEVAQGHWPMPSDA